MRTRSLRHSVIYYMGAFVFGCLLVTNALALVLAAPTNWLAISSGNGGDNETSIDWHVPFGGNATIPLLYGGRAVVDVVDSYVPLLDAKLWSGGSRDCSFAVYGEWGVGKSCGSNYAMGTELQYQYGVVGPVEGTRVPITVSGFMSYQRTGIEFPIQDPWNRYKAQVGVSFHDSWANTNFDIASQESGFRCQPGDCFQPFELHGWALTGEANIVSMYAEVRVIANCESGPFYSICPGQFVESTGRVTVDPLIAIDADFLVAHPSYAVVVSDGVGNQKAPGVEGVTEPATIALLGLGLAGIGFSRRKVKPKTLS